ncbi:hypothetical protein C8Q80DRAFT_672195 [Daedaleopsis nitida]|nr:hypothetical protein C8Q80DRAFT_672195 [Daedaleopsis nitida]
MYTDPRPSRLFPFQVSSYILQVPLPNHQSSLTTAKLTIVSAVALACAAAVQGASLGGLNATLVARSCNDHDKVLPQCQTSGGSPLVSDCVEALKRLEGPCRQNNDAGSFCQTQVSYGTCKIDVCGKVDTRIADGVHCSGYFQTILNECQSGGRVGVGGFIEPDGCNVLYDPYVVGFENHRLQFSHS